MRHDERHRWPNGNDGRRRSARLAWWIVSIILIVAGISAADLQGLRLPDVTPQWDVSRIGLLAVGIPLAILSMSMIGAALLRHRRGLARMESNPLPGDVYRQELQRRSVCLRTVWMVMVGFLVGGLSVHLIILALAEG